MAIEVFNRFESKYLLDENTFAKLERKLSDYMEPDAYNKSRQTYTITNLYYDTADNYLIRTSLAKPKYKEKLRLRAYGIADQNSKVFVEIKKKFNGLTNKRRSALELAEAYDFLQSGELPEATPYMNMQVLQEIKYILEQHELRPALYLAYDRRAYFGTGEHDLRVSFDCNIRSRRKDLSLEAGDYGEPLLTGNTWLMEIKSACSIPLWLVHLLSEYKIYPTSFSKYGVEYMQTMENNLRTPAFNVAFVPARRPQTSLVSA